jgi:putative permease
VKRAAKIAAIVLATLAVVALLWEFSGILLIFLLSVVIAAAVRPLVRSLVKRGWAEGLALGLVYLVGLVLAGAIVYAISGPLVGEFQSGTNDFTLAYDSVKAEWPHGNTIQQAIAERLPALADLVAALGGAQGRQFAEAAFGITFGSFDLIRNLLLVLMLSIYWSADRVHFERLWLSLLPVDHRAKAREIWRLSATRIGAYLRSEVVQSILVGLLLGLGYWLIGLRYPVTLAVIGAIAWLFPFVGAVLAVLPALLVGLLDSPASGAVAGSYTLVVLVIMETIVEPRIFRRRDLANPLLVVFLMMMLAEAFGILGLLLAPPLAAAIQITFHTMTQRSSELVTSEKALPRVKDLAARLTSVKEQTGVNGAQPSAELASIVERLEALLERTAEAL